MVFACCSDVTLAKPAQYCLTKAGSLPNHVRASVIADKSAKAMLEQNSRRGF
jgi:hypothetical protein